MMKTWKNQLIWVPFMVLLFMAKAHSSWFSVMEKKGFLLQIVDRASPDKSRDWFISLNDLKRMDPSSVKARGKEENPEHVWVGILLRTLLENEGIPLNRITQISISAYDGYMSVLTGDLLDHWGTALLAYQIEGVKKFPEKYGYTKLVFPDLMAMYWVNSPNRIMITLDGGDHKGNAYSVFFPGNETIKTLVLEEGSVPRIRIKDLLAAYDFPKDHFHVLTQDGLYREYSVNNIIQYMVLARDEADTWRIEGVRVPTGLKTRGIFFISSGDTGVFLKWPSSEEKKLWEKQVWMNRIFRHGQLNQGTLTLFLKNGERLGSNELADDFKKKLSLYDIFEKKLSVYPDLEYIRLEW